MRHEHYVLVVCLLGLFQQRQLGTPSASPLWISAAPVGNINSGGNSGNMIGVQGTQRGDGGNIGDGGDAAAGTTRSKGDPSTMPLTGDYEPSTSDWAREQTELFEKSGGTTGNTLRGMPIIVMTSVGARSGKLRKTPLMRVEQDGEYAVVASLGGAPNHPVWYHNLKKNPHVELQDGPVKRDYRAHEVTGEEKAAWWNRAVAAYPDYADYQKKTTRQIPVFVLTPMAEAENA